MERNTIPDSYSGYNRFDSCASATTPCYGEIFKRKKENIIKLISQKDFDELISNGIIGKCSIDGNNIAIGKHSSGYYDVKKYNQAKRETPETSERYLKTIAAHVGVAITRHKIYIEDEYVK